MRALVSTPGEAHVAEIREFEEPVPASSEVLIEVRSASFNRGELSLLAARPGWRPGQDIAGVVVQAASAPGGPQVGSHVAAVVDQAGWAERAAAPVSRVSLLPDTVTFSEGPLLGVAGLTALRALRVGGSLFGLRVAVTGAAGGVGTFAVQLAHLDGAHVTAVVGSRNRGRRLLELGARAVVLEDEERSGPFDLVLEGVGGVSLERSLHSLSPGGLVVLYGGASGQPARSPSLISGMLRAAASTGFSSTELGQIPLVSIWAIWLSSWEKSGSGPRSEWKSAGNNWTLPSRLSEIVRLRERSCSSSINDQLSLESHDFAAEPGPTHTPKEKRS